VVGLGQRLPAEIQAVLVVEHTVILLLGKMANRVKGSRVETVTRHLPGPRVVVVREL
jgi:hypothetical protein